MVKHILRLGLSALVLFGLASAPAKADPSPGLFIGIAAGAAIAAGEIFQTPQPDAKRAFILGGAGGFDFIARDNVAGSYQFEYRPGWQIWRAKPMIGMFGTSDGGVAGYLGIGYDLHITKNIVVNLNTAVTLYAAGNGKHLGSYAVLRSGVELGWRFEDASRLSVSVHHMSHGAIFDDKNPGTDVVAVTYAVPIEILGKLFGR
ncbi:MAG: acyloxyacyl hydrolase [Alphaproteobacteria bacterium]